MGGWWRWALVSPDGVAPSRVVSVSASVNLPLHHKVQKFSSGTGSPGWSRKKDRKTVVVMVVGLASKEIAVSYSKLLKASTGFQGLISPVVPVPLVWDKTVPSRLSLG